MGLSVLEIEVGSPANPGLTERVEFLVDSGAIYSVVPTRILEKLGIKPLSEQEFRLADGSKGNWGLTRLSILEFLLGQGIFIDFPD
jgi:predicted aspartyl protease